MSTVRTHQAHRVYTKAKWEDEWELQAGLYCNGFSNACGPDVSSAELEFEYGRIMRAGETAFEDVQPLDINGHLVRVELEQEEDGEEPGEGEDESPAIYWYGIVVDNNQGRRGRHAGITSGTQAITCRGLEFMLQRHYIRSSWVQRENDEIEIHRAIGFNLGSGNESQQFRRGNMELEGELGAPIFAKNLDDATEWTALDILDYLLIYLPPKNLDGDEVIPWRLATGVTEDLLRSFKPAIQVHGMSLFEILNAICDRRRLLGWKIEVETEDDEERPTIKVFSFNIDVISIPSGGDLHPNENPVFWFFDQDNTIQGVQILEDDSGRFDRVVVQGERITGCFPISQATSSLEADWSTDLQGDYNTGPTGDSGYAALPPDQKRNYIEAYRRSDKFKKVYRYFRVPPAWDGNIDSQTACPDPADVTAIEVADFWYPGMRFLPSLPLLTDHNYATVSENPDDETIAKSKAEYLRPYGIVEFEGRNYYIDQLSSGGISQDLLTSGGMWWSCHVRMQDDAFGVVLDVHGYPQHALCSDEFTATDDNDTYPAVLDWREIKVVVCAEFDQYVEAVEPEELDSDADQIRTLTIEVPRARLDWLCSGTPVGINADGTLITTTGGYVRDDRELLKDIAKAAFEWYSQERRSLQFSLMNLTTDKRTGYLIRAVGSAGDGAITVNSVITHMSYNLLQGTIAFRTQFGELDARAFASRGGAW